MNEYKNRFEEEEDLPKLPQGWVWTRLGEIAAKLQSGGTPSTKVKEFYENGEIPFVKIEDMVNTNKYLYNTATKITEKGLNNSSAWLVPENSLLYSMYASYGVPTINRIKAATSQAIIAFLPPNELLHLDYLYYYLCNIKSFLKRYIRGTTQENLNAAIVSGLPVPLAPLLEQKRIVTKIEELFTRLDVGIEALKKTREQLKRYRRAVLKFAFEGKLTEYDSSDEPADKLLEKLKEERRKKWEEGLIAQGKNPEKYNYKERKLLDTEGLAELPLGWIWTTIGEIFDVGTGGTPRRNERLYWNGEVPWVSSGEVAFCEIRETREHITQDGLENSNAKIYSPGTVLLALYGEGKTRGQAAILRIHATTNQAVAAILCSNSVVPSEYVYWWLYYRYHEIRRIGEGANQPNMYLHHVRSMPIPLAPIAEQQKIVKEIEYRLSIADETEKVVEKSLKQAEKLKQSILKKAFEGRLVPQDPSDEPASMLLERIKEEKGKLVADGKLKKTNKNKINGRQMRLA